MSVKCRATTRFILNKTSNLAGVVVRCLFLVNILYYKEKQQQEVWFYFYHLMEELKEEDQVFLLNERSAFLLLFFFKQIFLRDNVSKKRCRNISWSCPDETHSLLGSTSIERHLCVLVDSSLNKNRAISFRKFFDYPYKFCLNRCENCCIATSASCSSEEPLKQNEQSISLTFHINNTN